MPSLAPQRSFAAGNWTGAPRRALFAVAQGELWPLPSLHSRTSGISARSVPQAAPGPVIAE